MAAHCRDFWRPMIGAVLVLMAGARAWGQVSGGNATQPLVFGGVHITPDGVLSSRAGGAARPSSNAKDAGMAYVSLPRALAELQRSVEQKQAVPETLRAMGGLTQIRYVFVYAEAHDIVLAGPSEPVDLANPYAPVGRITGRPTVQLDDLIVALRTTRGRHAGDFYGCSLDIVPQALAKAGEVVRKMPQAPTATIAGEMKKAIGPQKVRLFGVGEDTRLAMAMLVADYRLKRMAMGGEAVPVPGVGNGLGSGAAANRLWFSPAYEPLLVSDAGDAYELRGPRLKIEAGAQMFETKGASDAATRFAKAFSDKMPMVAAKVDAIADLQNITDLLVVATLINTDKLDARASVDLSWALDPGRYSPAKLPVPREAETMVNVFPDSIVAGGVGISAMPLVRAQAREKDAANTLGPVRKRPQEGWHTIERPAARP